MKPKIFIGSSVEGLNVAYSIQQNLTHDAEITVWDQGVFELSSTTIESLVNVLEKSDFGIFVFSSDDITKIKDKEFNAVRDNVLFEFGLFIGKLTRERVYFVIPSDTELHLPTDLIGITPGKYDPNREDGSMQSATGPVSNQIRQKIKKIGRIFTDNEDQASSDKKPIVEDEDLIWIDDFASKKYDDAKKKLNSLIKKEKDTDIILSLKFWLVYCDFKVNQVDGIKLFDKLLKQNSESIDSHLLVARFYLNEEYLDKAIDILNDAIEKFKSNTSLLLMLSECFKKTDGTEKSVKFLSDNKPEENPKIALEIAYLLMETKDFRKAKDYLHKAYQNFPNNEKVKFSYAKVANELEEYEIALFLLDSLTEEFNKNSDYWGYLSNSAIMLDYYDIALSACRKAEAITESKEQWILANIGNMFKNKGFYKEGIKYLRKGLEIDKNNEYASDRLSRSIKSSIEEKKKFQNSCEKGRRLIREYKQK